MRCKPTPHQLAIINQVSQALRAVSTRHSYGPTTRYFRANGVMRCGWQHTWRDTGISRLSLMIQTVTTHGFTPVGTHDHAFAGTVYFNIGPYPESERISLPEHVLAANEGVVSRLLRDFRKHPLSQKVQDTSLLPLLGDALEDAGCTHNLLLALCHSASPSALYIIRND